MSESKMKINTKLNIHEYLAVTSELLFGYFDEGGRYQPHIGLLNAMRVFYNLCVIESNFDSAHPHNITDPFELDDVFADHDFILAFNHSIVDTDICLDFGQAYRDANKMASARLQSISAAADIIVNSVESLINTIKLNLSNEDLKSIVSVSKELLQNGITPDSIIESYSKSRAFQNAIGEGKQAVSAG